VELIVNKVYRVIVVLLWLYALLVIAATVMDSFK
jgi:hypothetical protein